MIDTCTLIAGVLLFCVTSVVVTLIPTNRTCFIAYYDHTFNTQIDSLIRLQKKASDHLGIDGNEESFTYEDQVSPAK